MIDEPSFGIDEIAGLAELPRRTVRYYIQAGLVDPPEGAGRGARYGRRHVEQLLQIRKWQLAGLSLERIAEIMRRPDADAPLPPAPRRPGTVEVWSHLVVADGVELVIEPGRARLSPEQVRALFRAVARIHAGIRGERAASPASTQHRAGDGAEKED
ncbi:MAG: MerR family transcriptional regulator [Alphaproteobacteria bacterium]|nr:MerR family transcriptional regulator [Alphaproteobacteria bacterium]